MTYESLWGWLHTPLFTLSGTPVNAFRIAGLVLLIVGAWWVTGRVEQAIRRVAANHPRSASSIYGWARVARYALWALVTIVGLNYLGLNLESFAILGGAVGVGIGFGLQNIFSNFFSGIILLMEKTIKEGDFVDLESGIRGHIREIGLRYTRLTTNDEVDVIVPNSEFINKRVVNWTFGSLNRRVHVPFGVAYGSDKQQVKDAALRAAASLGTTISQGNYQSDVWLVSLGDSSLNFELIVWVGSDATDFPARVEAAYLWEIHEELTQAGIEIPFPQRDLNVRTGELQVRLSRADRTGAAHPPGN